MKALPDTAKIRDALELFRKSRHSRFPVYEGSLDQIVGILFIKELLESIDPHGGAASLELSITEIMRSPYIVPGSKPISLLLARFKATRQQMAIVTDEFGGTAGLVTLEDILEEIVGDYDDEASMQIEMIKRRTDDGRFFVDPTARLHDLGPQIEYEFGSVPYNTLAGLVYHHLGHVAQAGERIELPGLEIVVEATDRHRLMEISLKKLPPSA